MQLANIIKICHKIHKLKLIVSVSRHPSIQHPSIQSPSIQHPSIQSPSIQCPSIQCPSIQSPSIQPSSPSTLRKALYIQCSSPQRLHPPSSTHIFIKASTRRSFPVQVLPPSRFLGQKAHFPCPSAPTVPDFGTEGAFSPPKCSYRPGFWDRGRIFPVQVLPLSHILGQRAHFPCPSAPTVPDFGTEGAFSPPKCSHRPGFRDRRRIFPVQLLPPSRILGQKAQLRDRRRIFPVQVLPPSLILGQKARFPRQSAPTVLDFWTEGAFFPSKCSHRPIFRDRRRIFPAKVLPPSRISGQKTQFSRPSAPTVPDFGTEGAVFPPKCSHRPIFWDRGRVSPAKVLPPSHI